MDGLVDLDGIVPLTPPAPVVTSTLPAPVRTLGINVNPAADPYRGVLAACPQGAPAKTQADWYMPGYQHIGQRLCDGQWVTCGNTYPCSTPTQKDGNPAWETGYGRGLGQPGDSGGYDYYVPPNGRQATTAPKWKQH